jgi:hypothetical protein
MAFSKIDLLYVSEGRIEDAYFHDEPNARKFFFVGPNQRVEMFLWPSIPLRSGFPCYISPVVLLVDWTRRANVRRVMNHR